MIFFYYSELCCFYIRICDKIVCIFGVCLLFLDNDLYVINVFGEREIILEYLIFGDIYFINRE